MKTCTIENYGYRVTADPKPVWFTSERYDYCEPLKESGFTKTSKKSTGLLQLFLSAIV